MTQRAFANRGIGIAEGTLFILLVLEKIWVDRTGRDAVFGGKFLDILRTLRAVRAVPQNVQSNGRTDSGQPVHQARVTEFLFRSCRGGWLDELSEASAGVGKTPGRQFNTEPVERSKDFVTRGRIHAEPLSRMRDYSASAGGQSITVHLG